MSGVSNDTDTRLCPYRLLCPFGRKLLEGNDECTKFYTGLTSWSIFKHLVTFLSTICPSLVSVQSKLSPFDSVLLTLMRLRLNLCMKDTAYSFDIGASTACNIFSRLDICPPQISHQMAITRSMPCKYAAGLQRSLPAHLLHH